ncbi:hypothetical protein [Asanoa sp. NPDC050611]|uniref:HAAS signaling domain-containing protein n=1 Tax=Asanoa sp. NPDC050611 TaxID=3157098 RepID=UPI0033EFFF17
MNVTNEQEEYLEAVRRALADLDPTSRGELLEDLPEHLAEVAAEGEGTLVERLGPPEAYAAELRTAAGVGVATAKWSGRFDDRVAAGFRSVRGSLGVADRKVGPVIGYSRFSEFLRLLRPAWWLLRGYLVAMAITVLAGNSQPGLLPRLGGSTLAATLLLAVCLLASIWLGRREPKLPPLARSGLALGGVFLVLFGMVGFDKADNYGGGFSDQPQTISNNPYEFVQDIYAYDENGKPLTNVYLFDQDGNPIRIGDPYRCQESYEFYERAVPDVAVGYPYCPNQQPYQVAPRPGQVRPPDGQLGGPEPTDSAPQPTTTPEPTTTPGPTTTPTPTPTATN